MRLTFILSFFCISGFCFAQTVQKTIFKLPDSGQINNYTNTFGEDSDYAIQAPGFTLNGNGTITDTVTQLMWQQSDGGEMRIEQARFYADTCTLGGYTDWRLPNPLEAFSILNMQKVNPALDQTYFSNSGAEYWWTSQTQANDTNKIWCTNAGGGIGNHPRTETISAGGTKKFHVRLVRQAAFQPVSGNRWTSTAEGFQLDFLTGLVWKSSPLTGLYSWEEALAAAENHTEAGYSDWRLPNIRELQSIQNPGRINPACDPVFSVLASGKYWSSTSLPNPNQSNKAWFWQSSFGITTYDLKTVTNGVLIVRGPDETPLKAQVENNRSSKPNLTWTDGGWQLKWSSTQSELWILADVSGRKLLEGRLESQELILPFRFGYGPFIFLTAGKPAVFIPGIGP